MNYNVRINSSIMQVRFQWQRLLCLYSLSYLLKLRGENNRYRGLHTHMLVQHGLKGRCHYSYYVDWLIGAIDHQLSQPSWDICHRILDDHIWSYITNVCCSNMFRLSLDWQIRPRLRYSPTNSTSKAEWRQQSTRRRPMTSPSGLVLL